MEPLIITGHANAMLGSGWEKRWDVATLSRECGDQVVIPKEEGPERGHAEDSWANLKDTPKTTLFEYLQGWEGQSLEGKPYVFDWSIQSHCPMMLENLTMPAYFSGDLLQDLPSDQGIAAKSAWPSLLVGPEGSGCGLHQDSLGSYYHHSG